jgi:hypothetical protein
VRITHFLPVSSFLVCYNCDLFIADLLPENTQLAVGVTCTDTDGPNGCEIQCTTGNFKPSDQTYKIKCESGEWKYYGGPGASPVLSTKQALGEWPNAVNL